MKMSRYSALRAMGAVIEMDPEYITGSRPASQGIPSQNIPGVPDTMEEILGLANPSPMVPSAASKLPWFLIAGGVLAVWIMKGGK